MKKILLTGLLCLCVISLPAWAQDGKYGPAPLDCLSLIGSILRAPCDILFHCLGGFDTGYGVPPECRPTRYPRKKRARTGRVKEPSVAEQPKVPQPKPTVERAAAPPEPPPRRVEPVRPGAVPSEAVPPQGTAPSERAVPPGGAVPSERAVPSGAAPPETVLEEVPRPRPQRPRARMAEPIAGPKVEKPPERTKKAPPRIRRRAPRQCYPPPYYYYYYRR
jgi:hypothetical protein